LTTKNSNKSGATINRFVQLVDVQKYDDGTRTATEIADILGIPVSSVKQSRKYLRELLNYGVTPETIQEKRSEIYIEYCQACEEAKKLFEKYRDAKGSAATDIKRFLVTWVEIIDRKAKLFGFDGVRVGELNINTQYNQQNNQIDTVDRELGKKIADVIKEEHEKKLKEKEVVDV